MVPCSTCVHMSCWQEIIEYGAIGDTFASVQAELETAASLDEGMPGPEAADADVADSTAKPAASGVAPATDPDGSNDEIAATTRKWLHFAQRVVRQYIKFVVEPKTQSLLRETLQDTKPTTVEPNSGEYILWVYDTKSCGETKTRPHLRVPPVREDHVSKLVGGSYTFRATDEGKLRNSDMFVLLDGGRDAERAFAQSFLQDNGKLAPRSKRVIYLQYSEDTSGRSLLRGFAAVNQIERMHLMTGTTLNLLERRRAIYPGTNRGNSIGLIAPDRDHELNMARDAKKDLFGPQGRLESAGATDLRGTSASTAEGCYENGEDDAEDLPEEGSDAGVSICCQPEPRP